MDFLQHGCLSRSLTLLSASTLEILAKGDQTIKSAHRFPIEQLGFDFPRRYLKRISKAKMDPHFAQVQTDGADERLAGG